MLLALSALFEHRGPRVWDSAGILALAYLAIVASAGAHTLSIWLASVTSATFASSWTYIAPFIALVVAGAVALNLDLLSTLRRNRVAMP